MRQISNYESHYLAGHDGADRSSHSSSTHAFSPAAGCKQNTCSDDGIYRDTITVTCVAQVDVHLTTD